MILNKKSILYLSISIFLVGCGGGGESDSSIPEKIIEKPIQTLPDFFETDFSEGDEIKVSSELNPNANYDFKTYKDISGILFDNSKEMTSGCSILVYKSYKQLPNLNYKVSDSDLILETYENDCILDNIRFTISNKSNEVMIIYSDDNITTYKLQNI